MPDTDAEATARAEADPMGLEVLEAVDMGGTWTVTGDGDAPPPPPPKPPAPAPATSSKLAERPPTPPPAPPPPPSPVRATPAANVAAPPRGGGRWLVAAAIFAGVAVAVPLAVAAGTFAYRVTNPPVPRAGPSAAARYLADASSTRIEAAAMSRGLRCGTPPQSVGSGGTATVRVCQRESSGWVASVAMAGQDPRHLVAVTAGVSRRPADEPTDLALLRAIVDASVAGRNAAADDAWLSAHFDQSGDSQTVVNGVLLRLTVHEAVRSLVIVPAP